LIVEHEYLTNAGIKDRDWTRFWACHIPMKPASVKYAWMLYFPNTRVYKA